MCTTMLLLQAEMIAALLTQHSQGDDEFDIEEQDCASLGQVSMPYVNKEVCNQDVGA